jgi:hypothetical protein
VFSSSRRLNILSSLLVVLAAGCGGGGLGCNGCASEPLPGGALPADQTVEGGGQIRVSPAGFTKISGLIESVVGDQLDGAGVCIPEQNFGSDFLGADLCNGNQGGCTPGCEVDINLDSVDVMPAGNALNVRAQLDVSASDNVNYTISFIPGTCTLSFNANDLVFDADIDLGIEPASGELTVDVGQINDLQFNVNSSGCVIGDIAGFIFDFLDFFDDLFGPVFANLLTPTINDLLDGMLPDPLGVEGMTDVGALVAGVSPGTEGNLETRLVPGGYVTLNNGGMSLGLITGFNADEDITTRTGDLDNEPAYCVPPFEAPDFAAAPHNLPVQPLRQTFMLPAADEFNGNPNPATDVAMGISETTLDLLGHHGVTSGAMCLGIGTTTVAQLNLGTIGLLVPSLLEQQSDQGSDPMLLVTRPQRALDFSIGEGTEESPSITIRIEDLEVDFYAFLYERYTRAFTMSLTLDAGINLEINQNPGEAATITPILVGLSSDNIGIEVLNSEFVRETPENLEAVLPTVFDLVLPLLAEGLPPIAVPEFAGFRMSDLTVARVQTDEDDFLAINASLNESPAMLAALAAHAGPRTEAYLADLQASSDAVPAAHLISQPIATLRAVATPAPDAIRAGLQVGDEAQLPTVAINAASADADGRALEWSWRLAGGLWRPFARPEGDVLTIRDRAFVWQGKHDLELRARLVDAPQTSVSGVSPVTAIIDSVEPVVEVEAAAWDSAGAFAVPAHDAVSGTTLTWAYGAPGADAPATAWASTPAAPRATIEGLTIDGEVAVFVRDEAGNETTALAKVAGFHGQADAAGCGGCQSQTGSGGALLVLITGTLLALGGRRGRARGLLAQGVARAHAGGRRGAAVARRVGGGVAGAGLQLRQRPERRVVRGPRGLHRAV